jgi:hypothetical protein
MTQDTHSIDAIDPSALAAVTGGGLFGTAWKAIKATYEVARPHASNAAPFAYLGYKAHSLWHKVTEKH